MNSEGLRAAASETQTPVQSFETAVKEAQNTFYDLTFEDGFAEAIAKQKLSPDDTDKPAYWREAADYAYARSRANSETQHDPEVILSELFAATPDFVYTQAILSRGRQAFPSNEAYHEARERASYFTGLLSEAAQAYPDAQASKMAVSLLNIANISIENTSVKMAATNIIRNKVRGVQHELAFGQLLAETGREYRAATTEEDLKGIDYVVEGRKGELRIDVKASLHELEVRGSHGKAYHVDPRDGQLKMYSLIQDRELQDRFFVPASVAEQKGAILNTMLRDIEIQEAAVAAGGATLRRWTS